MPRKKKEYFENLPKNRAGKKQITMWLTEDEKAALHKAAADEGVTVTAYIKRRIFSNQYYDKEKPIRVPKDITINMEAFLNFVLGFQKSSDEGAVGRPRKVKKLS